MIRIVLIAVVGYLMKNSLDDKKVKKVKKKTIAGDIMGGLNKLKKQALNSDQKHHHH